VDVWSLVTAEPAADDDGPDPSGRLHRLCRAAARALPASATGLSVFSANGDPAVIAASSTSARNIEQLQFTLGEGPCQDVYESGRPVLTPDVATAATRWPGYAPAALQHGVRAVFAIPLQVGASRLGALDVYRDTPGPLPGPALTQAFAFAEVAMTALLDSQERAGRRSGPDLGEALGAAVGGPLVVYQAQGMVHVQLGIPLTEALTRLRAYAYAHDRNLSDVAADVVAHRLLIESDP
jgi:GAF domain-containing protein